MFANQDINIVVKLTINEPPDAHQILKGKLVRHIKSVEEERLYYLFQDENGKWLVIKPRYESDQVEEVYLGKRVQVAIASVTDQDVVREGCFRLNQVNYFGIGAVTASED